MPWIFPLPNKTLGLTKDSMSFQKIDLNRQTEIPISPHPGAFAAVRRHHIHEGIDLYAVEGDMVIAVEDGTIVNIVPFTGEHAKSPWWHETWAVFVTGETGVVCYGEIIPDAGLSIGDKILAGDVVGIVKQVLKEDKGRPMSMLHLELYVHGVTEPVCADHPVKIEDTTLRDPTLYLVGAKRVCR